MFFIESLYWLSLCLYHECRGEPVDGQIAVAHVILNRSAQKQKTIKQIIRQPHQFSWYSDGIPDDIKNHDTFVICMNSAMIAIDSRFDGQTMSEIDHYHATYVSPYWAKKMTKIVQIGKHIFYKS